jgi:hypothetical protein
MIEFKVKMKRTINNGRHTIAFYVGDTLVATHYKYMEYFCSMTKNGTMSRIRDKCKRAGSLTWDEVGIQKVTGFDPGYISKNGNSKGPVTFVNDHPSTSWGYQGPLSVTAKFITNQLEAFANQYENITN